MISSFITGIAVFALTCGKMNVYACVALSVSVAIALYCFRGKTTVLLSTVSIDYYAQSSKLNEVNAFIKLVFALAMLLWVVACPSNLVAIFVLICMSVITLFVGKTNASYYLKVILVPGMFIVLSGISLAFDWGVAPSLYFDIPLAGGYLSVTQEGQAHATGVILKALAAVSCLYMLNLSTPVSELLAVLRKVKVPSLLLELLYLVYRYIFVVLAMLSAMSTASKTRLGGANIRAQMSSFLGIGSTLLLRSLKRARLSFDAMESRCYDGEIAFLTEEKTIKIHQIVAMAAVFFATVALGVLEESGVLVSIF